MPKSLKKGEPRQSPETLLLIPFLRDCYVKGEIATYSRIEQVAGGCALGGKRHLLNSALKIIKRDYGYLFSCIPRKGYKPIKDTDKVVSIEKNRLRRIKTQTSLWDLELSTVDLEELDDLQKDQYWTSRMKVSAHEIIMDQKLDEQYAIAAKTRVNNTGKVELTLDEVKEGFLALQGL